MRFQEDFKEGFLAFGIDNGVSPHSYHLTGERAEDGGVIGADADLGFLAGLDEGDVRGLDPRSHQQALFGRHHFHDGLAGLHHATDGGDEEAIHHPVQRRTQLAAGHLVAAPGQLLAQGGGAQFDLVLFLAGLGEKA